MNTIRKRRLYVVGVMMLGLAIAASLILYALKKNINVFITPSQITAEHIPLNHHFRLGGMVKKGSLIREKTGLGVEFVVTDLKNDITVHYIGVLPDLFREGKGAIVEGHLNTQNQFTATQVLAKHDENYMPKPLPYRSERAEGGSK